MTPTTLLPVLSVDLIERARRSSDEMAARTNEELESMLTRYRMFLKLATDHPDMPLAPTKDIDDMWHLHMLSPVAYQADCQALFGCILDHDGGFGATPEEEPELKAQFERTAQLFESTFGLPYVGTLGRCKGACSHRCHTKCKAN